MKIDKISTKSDRYSHNGKSSLMRSLIEDGFNYSTYQLPLLP
ncbi:hypothetical protein [Hyella patelloides]|nr:hypothetical protein [Hyella patelloides]